MNQNDECHNLTLFHRLLKRDWLAQAPHRHNIEVLSASFGVERKQHSAMLHRLRVQGNGHRYQGMGSGGLLMVRHDHYSSSS